MCGICGISNFRSQAPVSAQVLEQMNELIVHRGPNEDGFHIDGAIGLGMRRLSIIDLASGTQPIFNEAGDVAVVFNGEIYNFKQLRESLVTRGHRFQTDSDTEVIVHLYEDHGVDFVHHLNGMFAIALWDRTAQRLLLVRDRLGQKPLYYAYTKNGLVFGSELKCLLACPDTPIELDRSAIYHYFTLGYVPHPLSIYKGIRQLPPGCRVSIEREKTPRVERYWNLSSQVNTFEKSEDVADELRELLTDSVKKRMVSDVPVGAFLSGGLDSSITVALMAQLSEQSVSTFHIDFSDSASSERKYARQVASAFHTDHHEFMVNPSAVAVLDGLIDAFDEPFADTSAIPTFYVSKLAREHVTVVLAGDGGDETFGGYRRYQQILSRRRLPTAIRSSLGMIGRTIHRCLPRIAPGRRYFRSLGMSHDEWFAVGTSELETKELLSNELLREIDGTSTFELMEAYLSLGDRSDPLAPFTHCDALRYLPDDILTKVDRLSMAHSLEVRSPFLDHRVFELAAAVPAEHKIRGGETKLILKKAFRDILPAAVMEPRKRGFSVPMEHWLRSDLKEMLMDSLHDRAIAGSGLFRMQELHGLAREHFSRQRDRSDVLWRFLYFAHWWHRQQFRPKYGPPHFNVA